MQLLNHNLWVFYTRMYIDVAKNRGGDPRAAEHVWTDKPLYIVWQWGGFLIPSMDGWWTELSLPLPPMAMAVYVMTLQQCNTTSHFSIDNGWAQAIPSHHGKLGSRTEHSKNSSRGGGRISCWPATPSTLDTSTFQEFRLWERDVFFYIFDTSTRWNIKFQ